ncbi:hypothetical protein [Archangium violaceum]|nr:hypothetical protein [Archangium violaceum]
MSTDLAASVGLALARAAEVGPPLNADTTPPLRSVVAGHGLL